MTISRKELIKEYKQTARAAGVYQIRNTVNGKVFIGSAMDLRGIINSQKFQLSAGNHVNKSLQRDWNEYGADKFAFEISDELEQTAGQTSSRDELRSLEDLWLEKVQPYGDRGYNEKKIDTDERLKLISRNRS